MGKKSDHIRGSPAEQPRRAKVCRKLKRGGAEFLKQNQAQNRLENVCRKLEFDAQREREER